MNAEEVLQSLKEGFLGILCSRRLRVRHGDLGN